MSLFMSYIDGNGETRYEDRIRTTVEGRSGFGWSPFHHHTVSRVPQNCDVCHPTRPDAGEDDGSALRETYGFGNGGAIVEDGEGAAHDLSAFLDEAGELTADFPHSGTGPVPADVRERALSVEVAPPLSVEVAPPEPPLPPLPSEPPVPVDGGVHEPWTSPAAT